MPLSATAPLQVSAVKALGGEVRLVGESYTETQAYAWEVAEQEGRTFIAPYDDPFTVAGTPTLRHCVFHQTARRATRLQMLRPCVCSSVLRHSGRPQISPRT